MYAVEKYAAVRQFVFVEGKSRREAARFFGLSRDTVARMCRYSAPPGYVRTKLAEKPKLARIIGRRMAREDFAARIAKTANDNAPKPNHEPGYETGPESEDED